MLEMIRLLPLTVKRSRIMFEEPEIVPHISPSCIPLA